jgi:hypothetical protein
VHVSSWKQPDWLFNFWAWTIDKMEEWGWDDGVKKQHDEIIKAFIASKLK